MHPVLDDLALGNALEEQSRAHSGGIDARGPRTPLLRRQLAIDIVPSGETLRRRRKDVPQHLAPEPGDAPRFRAVKGDLKLFDQRHRITLRARLRARLSD